MERYYETMWWGLLFFIFVFIVWLLSFLLSQGSAENDVLIVPSLLNLVRSNVDSVVQIYQLKNKRQTLGI